MITEPMEEMLQHADYERVYWIYRSPDDILKLYNTGDMFNRTRAKERINKLYPGKRIEIRDTYGNKINDM